MCLPVAGRWGVPAIADGQWVDGRMGRDQPKQHWERGCFALLRHVGRVVRIAGAGVRQVGEPAVHNKHDPKNELKVNERAAGLRDGGRGERPQAGVRLGTAGHKPVGG